jgi:hypothetical protein
MESCTTYDISDAAVKRKSITCSTDQANVSPKKLRVEVEMKEPDATSAVCTNSELSQESNKLFKIDASDWRKRSFDSFHSPLKQTRHGVRSE